LLMIFLVCPMYRVLMLFLVIIMKKCEKKD
jgi:hypothetical protein